MCKGGEEGPEGAVVSSLSFHDQELLLRFTKLHPHSQQYFVWKIVDLLIERNKEEMRLIVPWSEKRTRTIRIRIATIGDSISVDFQLMPYTDCLCKPPSNLARGRNVLCKLLANGVLRMRFVK